MPMILYRYELPRYRDANTIELSIHRGGAVIHVDEIKRKLPDKLGRPVFDTFLWAIVDTNYPVERRKFWLVKDGDRLDALGDDAAMYHVATWRSVGGTLWQHVFEITHIPNFVPEHRVRRFPKREHQQVSAAEEGV